MLKKKDIEEYNRIITQHNNGEFSIVRVSNGRLMHIYPCTLAEVDKVSITKEKLALEKKDYDNTGKLRSPNVLVVKAILKSGKIKRLLFNMDELRLKLQLSGFIMYNPECPFEYRYRYTQ